MVVQPPTLENVFDKRSSLESPSGKSGRGVVGRRLAGTDEDEVIPGLCQRPRIEMVVFYTTLP